MPSLRRAIGARPGGRFGGWPISEWRSSITTLDGQTGFAEQRSRRRVAAPWLAGPVVHIGSTAVSGCPPKPVIDMLAPADLAHAQWRCQHCERMAFSCRMTVITPWFLRPQSQGLNASPAGRRDRRTGTPRHRAAGLPDAADAPTLRSEYASLKKHLVLTPYNRWQRLYQRQGRFRPQVCGGPGIAPSRDMLPSQPTTARTRTQGEMRKRSVSTPRASPERVPRPPLPEEGSHHAPPERPARQVIGPAPPSPAAPGCGLGQAPVILGGSGPSRDLVPDDDDRDHSGQHDPEHQAHGPGTQLKIPN